MIVLSASSLARAEACPWSASGPRIGQLHADATAGTEAHAEHEAACPADQIAEQPFAYNPETGTARLLPRGKHREYRGAREDEIPGTIDRIKVALPVVHVDDFKSGYGYMQAPAAVNLQLLHNALCAVSVYGAREAVVSLSGQEGVKSAAVLDAIDLDVGRDRILAIWREVHADKPRVVVGDHCWRCECMRYCPAYTLIFHAIGGGNLETVFAVRELTADLVGQTWPLRNAARKALAMYDSAVESWVQSNGPVTLPDGRELRFEAGSREELDGRVAYQVLRDLHGEKVAAAAVTMETSKDAIADAIAPIAPPRGKAKLNRDALEAIRAANGAVTKATKPKLTAVHTTAPALPAKTEAA